MRSVLELIAQGYEQAIHKIYQEGAFLKEGLEVKDPDRDKKQVSKT